MKLNWLNKKNNKKLIIFFNGWGMDDSAIVHLSPEDYDVLTKLCINKQLYSF